MKSEPAVIISAVSAAATAIIGVAVAFGADISDEQRNAILTAIAPVVLLIAALGPIIRQFVVSPESAAKAVIRAKTSDPQTAAVPEINVAGDAYNQAVKEAGFRPTPPPVNP